MGGCTHTSHPLFSYCNYRNVTPLIEPHTKHTVQEAQTATTPSPYKSNIGTLLDFISNVSYDRTYTTHCGTLVFMFVCSPLCHPAFTGTADWTNSVQLTSNINCHTTTTDDNDDGYGTFRSYTHGALRLQSSSCSHTARSGES